jgi:prepilin-type N-terminal cleavage/methylation domain-containing protein
MPDQQAIDMILPSPRAGARSGPKEGRAVQAFGEQGCKAFTLLEMSIVLVIIGLIIGGILIGRDLIRAYELRSVMTDIARFKTAVNAFKIKYGQLPGDFNKAESIWGSDANCPDTAYSATPHTATCNGDGNGQIYYAAREIYRFWQQLANAGLIEGAFTGTRGPSNLIQAVIGLNVPASKIAGGGYTVYAGEISGWPADTNWYTDVQTILGNPIYFGSVSGPNEFTRWPIISTVDAYNIDSKMDDGYPGTGKVVSFGSNSGLNPGCVTTHVTTTARYATSTGGILCNLVFVRAFEP